MATTDSDTCTVLLVDDEDTIVTSVRQALQSQGYTLVEAYDGESGLEIVRERAVDIIVSDYDMPGMDGMTFLQQARIVRPAVKGIILTGKATLDIVVAAINDPSVCKFIEKPWDLQALRDTVREVADLVKSKRRAS